MREPGNDLPEDEELPAPQPGPRLPTIDDEEPPAELAYQDWARESTKMVSGPLGTTTNFPGTRFVTRGEALKYWRGRAGRVIEDLSVPGRWIFRVRRDA